ncbi:MAG TPA: LytTR family DNA-binding domain-containing protein [Bryobacteraceae bacterium]|nr:LytTR family DNA-binding domain-containing protein [Bryobacteraceae bacterium]
MELRPLTAGIPPVCNFPGASGLSLEYSYKMGSGVLKALIVDDEPVARRILRDELELLPEVLIVGEACDGREALQCIAKLRPDVVFLDLQMPAMSGFEVVRNLGAPPLPVIVIVTAFDQHAIEAFEAGAIDYLLKPVSEARLRMSVERARALQGKPIEVASQLDKIAAAAASSRSPKGRKVVGRIGEDYYLLDPDEVLAFQAERELVWIVTSKQRMLATQSLRMIEERLNEPHFQRVHRNSIVNVNHIRKMSALSSQRWLITLSNSLQLVVSKRQAHNIRSILHW